MLSKDYSAEFKQRFVDRYADGATIAMLQHEFGYPQELKLRESTPIPLIPFTPSSSGCFPWAN